MANSMESLRDMMFVALVGLLFLVMVVCAWACYCRLSSHRGRSLLDQTAARRDQKKWVPFGVDDSVINYESLKKKETGGTQGDGGGSAFAPLG